MEETNMQETKKKGMSKGCIVGIVVVGVIIVLVVVGGFICYAKRDALVKFGVTSMVTGVKTHLADNPIEGVDTVSFNAIADRFVEKLDAEETLDPEKMQALGLQMQSLGQNIETLSPEQVKEFMNAMANMYPELKDMIPADLPSDEILDEATEQTEVVE